ncbi:unnamed protein product [Pocillopora meandrina]|uniref:Multidrug resistance-associated protein 5 n=1 Tax=Pocillopora meandrina TaxID=46732 RepID=A0AAU9W192_9CNID|nr:unnamed protein product [Pocillopora meandrina]
MASEESNDAHISTDQGQSPSNSRSPDEPELPSVQFTNDTAKQNKPVELISIEPVVDGRTSEGNHSGNDPDEEPSRKTGLSKYNWKNFLPFARRNPSKPAIDEAGFLSLMFLTWATPVIRKGFKGSLELEDFDKISPYESAEVNFKRGIRLWNEEVKERGLDNASIVRAIFVRNILEYIEEKDSSSRLEGIGWVIGLLLAEVGRSVFLSMSFFTNTRTGTRARAMILTMVYNKVSRLRNVGDRSIGEFVNLCASDADRVHQGVALCSFVFGFPVVITCTIIYTVIYIGPSALIGCGIFLLFFPIQVRMMNEILNCIKLIKMYAWEKSFAKAISGIRHQERKHLMKSAFLQGLNISMALIVPTIATVATFSVHVATGKNLTTSQAFTVTTLFNVLVFSLAILPFGIRSLAEGRIALKRLRSLMVMEELQPFVERPADPQVSLSILGATFAWDKVPFNWCEKKSKYFVCFETLVSEIPLSSSKNRKWQVLTFVGLKLLEEGRDNTTKKGSKQGGPRGRGPVEVRTTLESTLFDIDLTVNKKTLIGVCGSVGSGKSSLLQALLGQMRIQKGNVTIGGSIAYVAQQAWIMNATVKENILLGKPYNDSRYKTARFACSLEQDLKILPNGDETEIGERGINLSGGQKQRISLARALYYDMDIYLLDDPLSAVDAHVGQHIFKHCIKGALWNKTIIFATHQLQYLSQCDVVLYMKSGKIAERGTYEELIRNNGEFATLIRLFIREVEEELLEDEEDAFLPTPDAQQKPDSPTTPLSPDGIRKLVERTLSVGQRNNSTRDSFTDGNFEPFKLNNRISRRSRGSAKRRSSKKSGLEVEAAARREVDEKERRQQAGKLIQQEDRAEGAVTFETYKTYMKSAGGYCIFLFLMLFVTACLCGQLFIDTWLGIWLNAASEQKFLNITPEKSGIIAGNPTNNFYIMVYTLSAVGFFLGILIKSYLMVHFTLKSSSHLHDKVFHKVCRAPMAFFDTTPTGRILNRFSKDLDEIDIHLPFNVDASSLNIVRIFISIGMIATVFPWFLLGLAPLVVVFILINVVFNRSSRQLKRMDGITRSPIYSHITATVQGLSTLHAYNKMTEFNAVFKRYLDQNTRPFFMFFCAQRWLAVRLDMLTICIVGIAGLMVVLIKGTLPPAFLGLVLTYSLRMTSLLQFTVRQVAETEARFTSVERISYYIRSVPSEAELEIPDRKPAPDWPNGGVIKMSGVKMRYRDGLPLVLDDITFEIRTCEKIGIVGRTGSGKSSLGVLLWRLVEPEQGSMHIDDVDIRQIGLEDLRSRISIIPQDPVLFVGTVRYNLDPFKEHSDNEIWTALERAHLRETVDSLPAQLMAPVSENGENFSVGERQLICMARALLRNSKILLLDEATASIDPETDSKIQDTIRESFKHCTLLTIAHRLHTVMDSDRILVMDHGKIAEFDTPAALLANPDSSFSKLVQAMEISEEDHYLVE